MIIRNRKVSRNVKSFYIKESKRKKKDKKKGRVVESKYNRGCNWMGKRGR